MFSGIQSSRHCGLYIIIFNVYICIIVYIWYYMVICARHVASIRWPVHCLGGLNWTTSGCPKMGRKLVLFDTPAISASSRVLDSDWYVSYAHVSRFTCWLNSFLKFTVSPYCCLNQQICRFYHYPQICWILSNLLPCRLLAQIFNLRTSPVFHQPFQFWWLYLVMQVVSINRVKSYCSTAKRRLK